ncbi:MAG: phytoene desaturase family protein [Luminiphilus sp.]|nr:phytoene desaturase family protein [Luminiphilus sp.]
MSKKHVIVIGAGAGGLAAAVELAAAGRAVTVLDAAPTVGGKMHQVRSGEHWIDAGPTVFTMRWVFDELFANAGAQFASRLPFKPVTTLARHWWTSGASMDLHADPQVTAADIAALAGSADAEGYLQLCRDSGHIFELLKMSFMAAPQPNPITLALRIGLSRLGEMLALRPHQTLWRALGDYLRDPRLRQLFARYATYVGSSPLKAPATLLLITHSEQQGVWVLPGGMTSLARAMQNLAEEHGAQFKLNTNVAAINTHNGRVSGVTLDNGETLAADDIVFNGDRSALATGCLGPDVVLATRGTPVEQRGLSAVTWCLRADTAGFPLSYHNVFFDEDYPREFRALFDDKAVAERPTVYICAQDRLLAGHHEGHERLLVLVNAPATGDLSTWTREQMSQITARTEAILADCGLKMSLSSATCRMANPQDFASRFPGSGGSLYGQATHGLFSSFTRPSSRTKIPGLYMAGGSVHPGPGVPMATLSGRLAAQALLKQDQGPNKLIKLLLRFAPKPR